MTWRGCRRWRFPKAFCSFQTCRMILVAPPAAPPSGSHSESHMIPKATSPSRRRRKERVTAVPQDVERENVVTAHHVRKKGFGARSEDREDGEQPEQRRLEPQILAENAALDPLSELLPLLRMPSLRESPRIPWALIPPVIVGLANVAEPGVGSGRRSTLRWTTFPTSRTLATSSSGALRAERTVPTEAPEARP